MALVDDTRTDREASSWEALIREARERQRRRRRRRGAAALVALLGLAGGAVAVVGGGAASSVGLGVAGVLPVGISARAADPEGGLAWGMRVVRAGGWTCVQLGRLRGDALGVLGEDGSYRNDGRFHPFRPSTRNQAFCAQDDGNGHVFLNVQLGAQPASGVGAGYQTATQCRTAAELARARHFPTGRRSVALRQFLARQVVCRRADLRFVEYGLLGPDVGSVTYSVGGRSDVEQTHGPDGAYLVVAPDTPVLCRRLDPLGPCGRSGQSFGAEIVGGMVTAVRYRDGRTCRLNRKPGQPVFAVTCPLAGYSPARPPISKSQVAAHVSARLITARDYCVAQNAYPNSGFGQAQATDTGPYIPCGGHVPHGAIRSPPAHGAVIVFSWIAREPVTSSNSHYDFQIKSPCGVTQGNSTYGRIHAGERLTRGMFVSSRCKGRFTGAVGYNPNAGPGGVSDPGDDPGQHGSILVGRFTVAVS